MDGGKKKYMALQMSLGTNLLTIAPFGHVPNRNPASLDPKPLAVDVNNNVVVIFPEPRKKGCLAGCYWGR
jgi:hypothetical protein